MTNKRYKVSVIIPVYNVEKYLRQCLESVAGQTFKDIEVIVIDNNSPDNSAQIIKEFVEKYPNFTTYKRIGGGLGGARNEGLKHVNGEYIMFLDSDDFIAPDTVEKLYKAAVENDADISSSTFYLTDTEGKIIKTNKSFKQDFIIDAQRDDKVKMLIYGGNVACAWHKLIRSSIIIDNKLFFPENIPFEDIAFISTCFILANRYVQLKEPLWYYRYVQSSISNTKTELSPISYYKNFALMRDFLKEKGLYSGALAGEWEYHLLHMLIGGEEEGNGGLKKLSKPRLEEFFSATRDFYLNLPEDLFKNRNMVFRLKFKCFKTALKHNYYSMPKYVRGPINIFSAVHRIFFPIKKDEIYV